jgi:hypothetical protein
MYIGHNAGHMEDTNDKVTAVTTSVDGWLVLRLRKWVRNSIRQSPTPC